jgi:glutaredoxin 3
VDAGQPASGNFEKNQEEILIRIAGSAADRMSDKPKVVIYGSQTCNYCTAARMLLKKKGANYEDVLVNTNPKLREEMHRLTGRRSVPQILIGDRAVGGFDDLYALDKAGELDRLLGIQANTD